MKVIKENISNLKADINPAEDAVMVLDPTTAGAIDFSNRKEKEMQEIIDERTPEVEEDEEREEIMAKLNLDESLFDTARSHTDDLISAIEDGFLDWETVGFAALKYLSDDDVKELCDMNDWAIGTDFEEALNENADDSANSDGVEEEPIIEEDVSDVTGSVGDIIKTNIFPKMDNITSTNELLELVKAEFAEIDPKFRKYADEVIRNLAKKPFAKACIYLGDIMLKGAGLGSPDMHEDMCPECENEECAECDNECPECAEQPAEELKEEKSAWDKIQELLGEPIEIEEDAEIEECIEQEELNEAKEDISLYDRVYIDLDKQSGDDAKYRKFGKEFNSRRYDGPNEIFTAREDDGITVAADDLSFAQEVADAYDLDTKDDELDVKRTDEEGNEVWVTIPALTILMPYEEDLEGLKGLQEAYSRHFH